MYEPGFWLAISLIVVALAVGVYDVYVHFIASGLRSVSSYLSEWAVMFPILPVLLGIVIGHLFWPPPPRMMITTSHIPPTGPVP